MRRRRLDIVPPPRIVLHYPPVVLSASRRCRPSPINAVATAVVGPLLQLLQFRQTRKQMTETPVIALRRAYLRWLRAARAATRRWPGQGWVFAITGGVYSADAGAGAGWEVD